MEAIRCFTCGKVVGGKYAKFRKLIQTISHEDALDTIGLHRYCCRRMIMTSVDIASKVIDYNLVHDTMTENPYVNSKKQTVGPEGRSYSAR